jgi:hypothetical protein
MRRNQKFLPMWPTVLAQEPLLASKAASIVRKGDPKKIVSHIIQKR